jgi:hypothetical protein
VRSNVLYRGGVFSSRLLSREKKSWPDKAQDKQYGNQASRSAAHAKQKWHTALLLPTLPGVAAPTVGFMSLLIIVYRRHLMAGGCDGRRLARANAGVVIWRI